MHRELKHHLLREVVQDNMQTLSAEPPRGKVWRRRRTPSQVPTPRQPRQWRWQGLLLALALVLLPSYYTVTVPEPPRGTEQAHVTPAPVVPEPSPTGIARPPEPVLMMAAEDASDALPGPLAAQAASHELPLESVPHTVAPQAAEETPVGSQDAPILDGIGPTPEAIDLAVVSLAVKKIVLDPGHGGRDVGATAPTGLTEKDITLDIAQRLREILVQAGFDVVMTRQKDEFVSLAQRATFANTQSGDLFVSIHVNWIDGGQLRGLETYYLGPTKEPDLLQLAAQENRDSGYSLADYRRLLEGIYLDVRRHQSRRLAEATQKALVTSLRAVNPALVNRGVKMAPFAVLVATEMPAILAEVSCLSNPEEAHLLATSQYRQEIAQALWQGIRAYAQALNRSVKHRSAKKGY